MHSGMLRPGRYPRVETMGRMLARAVPALITIPLLLAVPGQAASAAPSSRCGWTIVPGRSPGTARNILFAVTSAPHGMPWAVGDRVSPENALNGGFSAEDVHDIDVAFFDPGDLSAQRDDAARQTLSALLDRPWEATNQAAVHTWFSEYFGGPTVAAFTSIHDAVATWPETATCVAIRTTPIGLDVCAPHGLADLLDGVWRRNPARVSTDNSAVRLARHRVADRWPSVTVIPPQAPVSVDGGPFLPQD